MQHCQEYSLSSCFQSSAAWPQGTGLVHAAMLPLTQKGWLPDCRLQMESHFYCNVAGFQYRISVNIERTSLRHMLKRACSQYAAIKTPTTMTPWLHNKGPTTNPTDKLLCVGPAYRRRRAEDSFPPCQAGEVMSNVSVMASNATSTPFHRSYKCSTYPTHNSARTTTTSTRSTLLSAA